MKTYSLKDFRRGIDANIYQKDGVARIEHFDPINGQLRQFGAIALSTSAAYGSDITANAFTAFATIGTTLYAIGFDSSASHPAIFKWNNSTQQWDGHVTFGAGASARGIVSYSPDAGTTTYLYGLYNGTNIYRSTVGGLIVTNQANLTYTNFANPLVHSKDNRVYFFTDNIVSSFDGTTVTTGLTLPANFRITSACEDGDYILIVGYNTNGVATGYLWDRDSSLTTVTAKYDLGRDTPKAVARIGGNSFIVSHRSDTTFTDWDDQSVLVVRVRNGDRADILSEYQMPTFQFAGNSSFATSHSMYFYAYAKLRNDASAKNVVFGLDHQGKLFIALNMAVDATASAPTFGGVFRDGDGWWVAGSTQGSFHGDNSYATESIFETNIIRSEDFDADVIFSKAIITCEPLVSGGSITLKAKTDNDSSWTTLKAFTIANGMKFSLPALQAANALPRIAKSKQFQLQIVATGASATSVIITGFKCDYDEKAHDANPT